MRAELEALLDRAKDYQDRAFEWAEAWFKAADQFSVPCFRGEELISWAKWYGEISKVGDRPGLTAEIIKQSVYEAITGISVPGRNFGADIRYAAWWSHEWSAKDFRAMCEELVNIHQDYDLGCDVFESYDQWLAVLLKDAPPRQVSL